ncbi:MAG: hypothetical protein HGA45_41865 [Chloroflexales bacterium]|nr:hypothetical protein [Chloroflexales bacterium]
MNFILRPFAVFVQHPERSALVAALFFVLWLVIWNSTGRGTKLRDLGLLIPAAAWCLYTLWEWAVNRFTPEADIRVDMLLIVPLLIIATIAGVVLPLVGRIRTSG